MTRILSKLALAAVMLAVVLCAGAIVFVAMLPAPAPAAAQTVGTYTIHRVADGTTAYTTSSNLTGWEISDYGTVVIQAIADASNTTSTLTITPQYSLVTGVPCSDVDDWVDGADYIAYSSAPQYGIVQHVPISYTVNSTDSLAFTGVTAEISYTVNTTASLAWTGTGSTTLTGSTPYVLTTTYTYADPETTLTGSVPYVVTTTYTYADPVVTTYTLSSAAAGYVSVSQSMSLTGDTYSIHQFATYGRCMRLHLAVSAGTITPTIYIMDRDVEQ